VKPRLVRALFSCANWSLARTVRGLFTGHLFRRGQETMVLVEGNPGDKLSITRLTIIYRDAGVA